MEFWHIHAKTPRVIAAWVSCNDITIGNASYQIV